jgi:hypothetical protein
MTIAATRSIKRLLPGDRQLATPRVTQSIRSVFTAAIYEFASHTHTLAPGDLNQLRRVSDCRDLVQFPVAA